MSVAIDIGVHPEPGRVIPTDALRDFADVACG